jgi:hypothetical protein
LGDSKAGRSSLVGAERVGRSVIPGSIAASSPRVRAMRLKLTVRSFPSSWRRNSADAVAVLWLLETLHRNDGCPVAPADQVTKVVADHWAEDTDGSRAGKFRIPSSTTKKMTA